MNINTKSEPASILVMVAHSDDETFGMAGTIARHVSEGDRVFGAYLTNGVSSREDAKKAIIDRELSANLAAKELGLEWIGKYDFPDNALDTIPLLDIIKTVEEVKKIVNPSLVYTHHFGDLNIDHKITFQATMTAFRPQPNETCQEIRAFEVPSATEYGVFGMQNAFVPNLYIDIEDFWDIKKATLEHYHTEMREPPHPRSIEGLDCLSKIRGMSAGLSRAEAFTILRKTLI
ncbi:MAG: GlcNAc-PI de-N-acetylase [Legionellales bacterium]|nr:GlcNAc-PI de-N-acetylase [Legionellales bacterium]